MQKLKQPEVAAEVLMADTSGRSGEASPIERMTAPAAIIESVSEKPTRSLLDLLLSRLSDLVGLIQRHRESPERAVSLQEVYELGIRDELLNVVLRGRFKTNDLVRLTGSLPARRGVLAVNSEHIELENLREFAVALILCQALKSAPAYGDSGFVPVEEIVVRVVQEFLRHNPSLESEWRYPGPEDIHRVVNSLRGKLKDRNLLNPFLIESGQRGQGYRISTPPWNVQILCD